MLKNHILMAVIVVALAATVAAEELSQEQQREIIERYMYATGQIATRPASLGEVDEEPGLPVKCGTPAILEFQRNYDRLDRRLLAALGVEADYPRPVMQFEYGLPGGHTLIHYNTTGDSAVWQANIDRDSDGVPDYIESVAAIADSCYGHIVDTLGFTPPLTDSICVDGGDGRIDIYLLGLPFGFYGATYNQSECYDPGNQHEAAWILMDADFQLLPDYVGRPLDAARVTLAHEIFHTVHFAIDATEHVSWFEMSAVWMEEEIYDEVNDYYLYDQLYFDWPGVSLQDTIIPNHMYQAAVFPIYLTEKYGRNVVKAVWDRSGAMGPGPDFLEAFGTVIDSASIDPANARYDCLCYNQDSTICLDSTLIQGSFASAFAEFAVWNFFTGEFADQAPDGVGYSEGEHYAEIPLEKMEVHRNYPFDLGFFDDIKEPQPNAALYIRLENLQAIDLDTLLTMWVKPDTVSVIRWGVSSIFQMEDNPDSHVVVTDVVDNWRTYFCVDSSCSQWDYTATDSTCVEYVCDSIRPFSGRYLGEMVGQWVCTDGEFGTTIPCGPSTCADSVRAINLGPYRSITVVMTPTEFNPGPYIYGDTVEITYSVGDSSIIDQGLVGLPAAVLTPYPNPAVAAELGDDGLTFRFQAPTDETSFAATSQLLLHLDIFTVAGEMVGTVERVFQGEDREGPRPGGVFEVSWDMKNQAGKDVASGVYLAVARLYEGTNKSVLLVEDRTKVAVIR